MHMEYTSIGKLSLFSRSKNEKKMHYQRSMTNYFRCHMCDVSLVISSLNQLKKWFEFVPCMAEYNFNLLNTDACCWIKMSNHSQLRSKAYNPISCVFFFLNTFSSNQNFKNQTNIFSIKNFGPICIWLSILLNESNFGNRTSKYWLNNIGLFIFQQNI